MAQRATQRMKAVAETIVIGSDHAGFAMKEFIKEELRKQRFAVKDVGTYTAEEPCDYPVYVSKVAAAVSEGHYLRGIAVDGNGVGSSVVANRFPRVRAALCNDIGVARMSRAHADANILVIAGRLTPEWLTAQILDAWLHTRFEGGRHSRRVKLIDDNTQLSIAMRHLSQIDPKRIDTASVNEPFVRRTLKGLQKMVTLLKLDDRRSEQEARMAEACPSTIEWEGVKLSGLMMDLSARGAQFRIQGKADLGKFLLDDTVECRVKTPYGVSACKGTVKWVDTASRTIGVSVTDMSRDKSDPLRLLQDSML
jgi:ribose 5-phosphate isomerase B